MGYSRLFGIFVILIFLCNSAHSQFWSELWQDASYRRTNLSASDNNPNETHFYLNTTAFRVGYRNYVNTISQNRRIRSALDVYGRIENVYDFSVNRQRYPNIYNNNLKCGFGTKLRVQWEDTASHWFRYIQTDLLSEYVWINTLSNTVRQNLDIIETKNWRTGINGWANSGNKLRCGYELYFDASYHTTNFAGLGEKNYLIMVFAPKFYYRILGSMLDIYAGGEYVNDFLSQNQWNKNPYSNNIKGNVGIRIQPFRQDSSKLTNDSSPISLLFYVEYIQVHYCQNPQNWQIYDNDFRAGIIIWWPLGEARYRMAGGQVPPF